MKTLFRILLALGLLTQWPAHAAGSAPASEHFSSKSRPDKDRKAFGDYVAQKMADAFDGKLAETYPCGNKPDYYCQGLMVTAFEKADPYWMDPKTPRISFTYFRKDIAAPLFGNAGLALWPQAYLDHDFPMVGQEHQSFKPVYRCAYPTDGGTALRTNSGCGPQIYQGAQVPDTAPCATLGITTAQQWADKYSGDLAQTCGFGLNPADGSDRRGMAAMIQAEAILQKTGIPNPMPWNEVVMGPWPSYAPGRIPLMAFFWIDDDSALSAAQQQQKRYYDLTNIFVPIIRISAASPNAAFMYWDWVQAPGIPPFVTTMPQ